jgi:hypothetical protein
LKIIFATIFALFCFAHVHAQADTKPLKYAIALDSTNVDIEIWPALQAASNTIYLINFKDSLNGFSTDTTFQNFAKQFSEKLSFVKIIFNDVADTLSAKTIATLANSLSNEIIPDSRKKYPKIITDNFVLVGLNTGGIIAITSACFFPEKINKVAAFFENDEPTLSNSDAINLVAAKIKGKLFVHTSQKNTTTNNTNLLVDNLALKSSAMLYKIDDFEDALTVDILAEAYYWLMANGNNYIIKIE